MEKINYKNEEKILITISIDKFNEFIKISNKYSWEITDKKLYRTIKPKVIVNCII